MKRVIRAGKEIGREMTDYQKWVDYDMKRYGKISDTTMSKIKKAGLSVVKDQYGDYEVIGDDKIESGCHGKKKVESGCHGKKKVTASLDDEFEAIEAIKGCKIKIKEILRLLGEAYYRATPDDAEDFDDFELPDIEAMIETAKDLDEQFAVYLDNNKFIQ